VKHWIYVHDWLLLSLKESLMFHLIQGGIVFVFVKVLLELLPKESFEANNLDFDCLLAIVVLCYMDAIFVKGAVRDAQLLGMLEGFKNLKSDLCDNFLS
jgi:hypothetical protein